MSATHLVAILALLVVVCAGQQQVHVSFHSDQNSLVVQWLDFTGYTNQSLVRYGLSADSLPYTIRANQITSFTDLRCPTERYTYEAVLSNLSSDTVYYYQVSSDGENWSEVFNILTLKSDYSTESLVVSIFGDMTSQSFVPVTSVQQLTKNTQEHTHDFVIHTGDIAYNLDTDCGQQGDTFMTEVEGISAYSVYMFGVGDHERDTTTTYDNYKHRYCGERYVGVGDIDDWLNRYFYWTKEIPGLAKFVYINTGAWIDVAAFPTMRKQYQWLEAELAATNRTYTPWLIVVGHRSLYCTKTNDTECNLEAEILRDGWPGGFFPLEPLMYNYGVDVYQGGHTHHYQRTWPTYQSEPVQTNYNNPGATVYVTSGLGGPPSIDYIDVPSPSYMAFTDFTYTFGYTSYTFNSTSQLNVAQRSATDNSFVDQFTIIQSNHGSFSSTQ